MMRSRRVLASAVAIAGASVLVASAVRAQPEARRRTGQLRRFGGGLKVGQAAPDFELPILKTGKTPDGKQIHRITDKKVRLSSFRGRKIVCAFFSSYT